MPAIDYSRVFALRNWIISVAASAFVQAVTVAVAQSNSAPPSLASQLAELRLGPFDLHPRFGAGLTYDDNFLYSTTGREADAIWMFQPAMQAVAGDDAGLIAYRDRNLDVLALVPGNLILLQPEDRPGKLLILDYGPRFQFFDRYTANNSVDEFATVDLLWPMEKLILGFRQDYQLQKEAIIEAGQRTSVENIPTTLSAAYQFGDKTSMETDLRRFSVGYQAAGLVGYTEYNTEDWFNYSLAEDLPVSLGVLAGEDEVANHQDQDYEQLRARSRYIYTEKLTFDASVGGELREYENGKGETLAPVFTVAGDYRPSERTSFRLTGYRQQYAAIVYGFYYASTGASLEVRQGITDRFTASLAAGYYSLEYTYFSGALPTHTSGYYTARIGLEAKIVRHLSGQIFSQWIGRQSLIDRDISENQTGGQLTLSF
jgi:hypothetical protein